MGVPGLWDVLRPAGHTRSMTHLSVVDGFDHSPPNLRGYRVGVDAFIWIFHSEWGREGENPQLRTIMFRIVKLINSPFLPLFVFDGPGRPSEKRGKKVQKRRAPALVEGIKRLITAFGLEWRTAPGEAEAELAYLNNIGVIDGIISDDVDAFLFGAKVIIRNPSATLSGNKSHNNVNASGKQDNLHTTIYCAEDILKHPSIQLCQGGLILFALLSGGDYHVAGLKGCGRGTAHALARCGLGRKLLVAARTLPLGELKNAFLPSWREELRQELCTDSCGYLGRKCPSLAKSISDDFPDVDVLLSYTNPLTTEIAARGRNKEEISWNKDPSPAEVAAACEQFFEWGYEEMMLYRFRKWLWSPLVCRMLRRTALHRDREALSTRHTGNLTDTPRGRVAKQFTNLVLTDSRACDQEDANEKLVVKIHGQRTHASTDGLLEYRLEINPASLVHQCRQGILGTRSKPEKDEEYAQEDERDLAASSNPYEHLRVWMPASVVKLAEPNLVTEWEDSKQRKPGKSLSKRRTKGTAANNYSDDELPSLYPQNSNSKNLRTAKRSVIPRSQLNPVGEGKSEETTYLSEPLQPAIPSLLPKGKAKSNGRPVDMKDCFVTTKPQRGGAPPQVDTSVSSHIGAASMPTPQAPVRNRADSPLPKQISLPQVVSVPDPTTLEVLLSISSQVPPQSKCKVESARRQPFPLVLDPSPGSREPFSYSSPPSWDEPSQFESSQSAFKSKAPSSPGSPRADVTHWDRNDRGINSNRNGVPPSLLGGNSKSTLSMSHSRQDVIDVIEISSDSDMPSSLKLLAPKRRVKEVPGKVLRRGASNNACASAGSQGEIIDLT